MSEKLFTQRVKEHVEVQIEHPDRSYGLPPTEPLHRRMSNPQVGIRVGAAFRVLVEQGKYTDKYKKAGRRMADAIAMLVEQIDKDQAGERFWEKIDEALASFEDLE